MPRRPDPKYNTTEFRRLWYSRLTLKEIGARYETTAAAIYSAGRKRGLPMRSKMRPGDEVKI